MDICKIHNDTKEGPPQAVPLQNSALTGRVHKFHIIDFDTFGNISYEMQVSSKLKARLVKVYSSDNACGTQSNEPCGTNKLCGTSCLNLSDSMFS